MPQFTLNWDNTAILSEPNVIGQRALYRKKLNGSTFISAGFTPTNDLPKAATTVLSPVLLSNYIYQFKILTLCTVNGPTINSNGVIDQIKFSCITPNVDFTDVSSTIAVFATDLDDTPFDITKIRFTLRKDSDSSIVFGPTIVMPGVANIFTATATGLDPNTDYYWQYEMYSVINGVEVISSSVDYLDEVCQAYPFTTSDIVSCTAPEDLVVTNTP